MYVLVGGGVGRDDRDVATWKGRGGRKGVGMPEKDLAVMARLVTGVLRDTCSA